MIIHLAAHKDTSEDPAAKRESTGFRKLLLDLQKIYNSIKEPIEKLKAEGACSGCGSALKEKGMREFSYP
jgi:hypothetical protein